MAMTEEEITGTIRSARDSVWVVNDALQKLQNGQELTTEIRNLIDRNVAHLKLVVGNPDVANSGQDISDLNQAIIDGVAALQ